MGAIKSKFSIQTSDTIKGYCLLVFIGFAVPVGGWVTSTPVVVGGEGVVVVVTIGSEGVVVVTAVAVVAGGEGVVVVVCLIGQYALCLMSS